jgi:hypothetical protein
MGHYSLASCDQPCICEPRDVTKLQARRKQEEARGMGFALEALEMSSFKTRVGDEVTHLEKVGVFALFFYSKMC